MIRTIGIVVVLTVLTSGCIGSGSKSGLTGDPLALVAEDEAAVVDGEVTDQVAGRTDGTGEAGTVMAAADAGQPAPKARPPAPTNVSAPVQPAADVARDQAVAEIRAKAAAAAANNDPQAFPNVFASPASETVVIKSVAEVETIEDNLQGAGQQSAGAEADEAFKKRALLLWQLGQTHAQDTADAIATGGNAGQ